MLFRFITLVWQLLAVSMASLSTVFYIFLQILHNLLSFGSETWLNIASARAFNFAFLNFQIRCCQILYWPILLQDKDHRWQDIVCKIFWNSLIEKVSFCNEIQIFWFDSAQNIIYYLRFYQLQDKFGFYTYRIKKWNFHF